MSKDNAKIEDEEKSTPAIEVKMEVVFMQHDCWSDTCIKLVNYHTIRFFPTLWNIIQYIMYFYVKLNDETYKVVDDSQIPRVDVSFVDKFK